jgi:hypothetical protein
MVLSNPEAQRSPAKKRKASKDRQGLDEFQWSDIARRLAPIEASSARTRARKARAARTIAALALCVHADLGKPSSLRGEARGVRFIEPD